MDALYAEWMRRLQMVLGQRPKPAPRR